MLGHLEFTKGLAQIWVFHLYPIIYLNHIEKKKRKMGI